MRIKQFIQFVGVAILVVMLILQLANHPITHDSEKVGEICQIYKDLEGNESLLCEDDVIYHTKDIFWLFWGFGLLMAVGSWFIEEEK